MSHAVVSVGKPANLAKLRKVFEGAYKFKVETLSGAEEDVQEVYAATLTTKQVADGYEPWQEKIHVNYFYQKVLTDKDLQMKKFKS